MAKKNRKNQMRSVLAPMDRRRINREARARTQLEFGPTQRAIQGDLRASRQQTRNINSWYQQYQNQMNALRTQQAGNTQALQDQMNRNAEALGGQAAARSSAVADDQSRSAAIRGAMVDPSAGATESAADRQRQALLASSRDRAAQMGASSNQRLADVNAAAELGRQADQRQERNTRLESRAKMRDLARDRGAARIKNIGDLTRAERDFFIQRRTLNSNIRNDQAQLALDRQRENRIASEGSGGSGGSGGGGQGGGGNAKENRQAMAYARDGIRDAGGTWGNWRELKANKTVIIDGLINRGVDPAVARRTYNTLLNRWRRQRGGRPAKPGRGDYRG